MIQSAWMIPGTKPMIVSTMFKKKWNEKPTCKNTPTGGRMIASIIRSMSNFYSFGLVSPPLLPRIPGPPNPRSYSLNSFHASYVLAGA